MTDLKAIKDDLVFGLDIGTRSIVGVVGYLSHQVFHVVAMAEEKHATRAMLDGQIHDIYKVGDTIRRVKNSLERQIGFALTDVCIAAAGRVLKTVNASAEYAFENETRVTQEHIYSLNLLAVEKAHAQVNDSTYVEGLLRGDMNFKDKDDSDVTMQRLYVHHDFGDNVSVNIGKYAQFFGQTGMFFDDEIKGAEAIIHFNDVADLTVGYGRVNGYTDEFLGDIDPNVGEFWKAAGDVDFTYARLAGNAFMNRVAYDVEYIKGHGEAKDALNIWGAGLTVGVTDKIDVFGDYYKNTKDVMQFGKKPVAWTAGIGFGQQDMARPGSFRVSAAYVDAKFGAVTPSYTYDVSPIYGVVAGVPQVKYWSATADVTVAKNVSLHGEYAFNVKAFDVNGNRFDADIDDLATVSLNYVF